MTDRPVHIVAAAGGGQRIGLHLGIAESGVLGHVDAWVGTSTGALFAFGMGTGGLPFVQDMFNTVVKKGSKAIFSTPWYGKEINFLRTGAFFKSDPLKKLIGSAPKSERPWAALACDLHTGDRVFADHFLDGVDPDTARARVLASSSVPGFFPLVEGRYGDGGVRDITPIGLAFDTARMLGCKPQEHFKLTVILTSPFEVPITDKVDGTFGPALRALEIHSNEVMRTDLLEIAAHNSRPGMLQADLAVYAPTVDFGSALDFQGERMQASREYARDEMSQHPLTMPQILDLLA